MENQRHKKRYMTEKSKGNQIMCKRMIILFSAFVLMLSITTGSADQSDGDLIAFCPAMCTLYYNTLLSNYLKLNDTQAALLQVSSDGLEDGNLVYSDVLQNTIFVFGGVSNEYDTASTAYIYCSLEDSSPLKNVPMLLWGALIDMKYNGDLKETGSSFIEWVNEGRSNGETYTSPYFYATYSEEPKDNCTLLLVKW